MLPEFTKQYPQSLNRIFISESETCDIHGFVRQYIESRNLRGNYQAQHDVVTALQDYPGLAPVRLYELNAWLDKTFRRKIFCRPAARLLKRMSNNDYIPRCG
ncbi:hypothetical protein D3C76_1074420 [compost metagenome]|jgi:hypothetical protein|uniref:Uncharacterized protein n=1 Tax=Pseudomonas alkylphenolica TaxID=237609 RepID=A0A6I6GWX5_9PSED|nr:hypothetical protein [Pseudomonas alkylphenolica]QGW79033.1 hypothetical protein GPJ81_20845 [Pseudomonas alkylphenolica]